MSAFLAANTNQCYLMLCSSIALDSLSFPPDHSPFSGAPKENINNSTRFLLVSASLPPVANNLTTAIAIDT